MLIIKPLKRAYSLLPRSKMPCVNVLRELLTHGLYVFNSSDDVDLGRRHHPFTVFLVINRMNYISMTSVFPI